MAAIKVGISFARLQDWFGGDFSKAIDLAQLADETGLDQISLADHLIMTDAGGNAYPGAPSSYKPTALHWPEPVTLLAAMASRTSRIQLATGILIAPLRSAILLAKQLATLDQIAQGRLVAGLGVGWQQAEYEFSRLPWNTRFAFLTEQIEALRALWGPQPATYNGKHIAFDGAYALPRPFGDRSIPIWLGLGVGPHNLERIARLADGWMPMRTDVDGILAETRIVRDACVAIGREPSTLSIRASPDSGLPGSNRDMSRLADDIARLADGGIDIVQVYPFGLASAASECRVLFERLTKIRDSLA